MRQATANRDDARNAFERAQLLSGRGLLTQADRDTAETRLKVAEANYQATLDTVHSLKASLQDRRASYELAQKKLADAVIKAPVAGSISERLIQPGEFIRENTPVATIVQMNPLKLKTAIQEKHASLIRPGQTVEFDVEAFLNRKFKGRIAYVSPAVDQATRTFAVEALVDNADRQLKPGFFAKGIVLTRLDENVIAVPEDAISTLAGVSTVYVIEDGKARAQQVTLGRAAGQARGNHERPQRRRAARDDEPEPARHRRHRQRRRAGRRGRRPRRAGNRAGRRPPGSASMKIAEVSVERPVFAIMMTAALIVLGAVSYESLGLDLMPKTDVPVVSVQANLPGASAEEIETQITKRIEEAVNTISGIDELRASSDQGNSRVTINFTLERDIESATQDVRDKLAQIVNQFPRDTRPLQITKMDPDSQPIFGFAVYGPRAPKELTEIAEKRVKQELETVKDVGSVGYNGERKREIQLLLDADRLNAYGLTVDEVRTAVQRQNVEIPGGQFTAGPADVAVRTMGRIRNVDDFNRIVIAYRTDGSVITFADVGRVQDSVQEVRSATRLSGTPAIGVQVRKQSGTNTVEVVDRVQERLARIQSQLPQDIQISVGNDQSRFIRRSFEDIKMHLILGGLLASVVVFLFIRNLRITFIAALAIPTSIIGTFTFMNMAGFTLNNMTMLALSLATGIVIDDAIVVLENIFRYVEEKGVSPKEAAAAATQEIGMAVMATTFSLVVIFVPVAFMTGQIGRYFYSFGLTSAAAILISMFVSFTLTPALCAMWMKKEDIKSDHSTTKSGGVYAKIDARLRPDAGVVAAPSARDDGDRRRRRAVGGLPVSVCRQGARARRRPGRIQHQRAAAARHELPAHRGVHQADRKRGPRAAGAAAGDAERELGLRELQHHDAAARGAGRHAAGADDPGAADAAQVPGRAHQRLGRHRHLGRVERRRRPGGPGGGGPGGGGGGGGFNRLNILIQGPDIQQLQEYTTQLLAKVREIPGVVDADTNFEPTQPELRINVDRARAADLGVNIDSLANSLRTLVGGEEVSEFKDGDDQFKVLLRLDEAHRNPATMGDLLIPAGPGKTVKVSDVAALKNDYGPAAIDRYNRQRQISVNGNLQGVPLGEALAAARAKVEELHLKPGYQAVFGGSARTLAEASSNFTIALVLAVIFIYMVLASQFNSFIHPADDHDGAAAQPAGRPAGADGVRDDAQRLQRDRPDDAVRHRQEELDSAGRLHEHAPRAGRRAARGAHPGQPRAPAPDSDDDDRHHRGHAADRVRQGRRRRLARLDGGHHPGRPDPLPGTDASGHAGRVLVFRRPEGMEPEGSAQAARPAGPRQARDRQSAQ